MSIGKRAVKHFRPTVWYVVAIITAILSLPLLWMFFLWLMKGVVLAHSTKRLIAIPLALLAGFLIYSTLKNVVYGIDETEVEEDDLNEFD